MPGDFRAAGGEARTLGLLEHRRGFDQMHVERIEELRHDAGGPQEVGHQGAATGAKFDQAQALRQAQCAPELHGPKADELAEHLADLGRGDGRGRV